MLGQVSLMSYYIVAMKTVITGRYFGNYINESILLTQCEAWVEIV